MLNLGAQLKIKEKRKLKRFSVNLKVYSQQSDELLGYAENLNLQGMMIVTQKPLPEKKELQVWFGTSKEDKHLNRIFLSAYRVWESFTDTKNRLYYSGLHFVTPSESTLDKVQLLINEFND